MKNKMMKKAMPAKKAMPMKKSRMPKMPKKK
jgi:hypothetical protein